MSKMSRDKGKRGEREFAAYCRAYGYDAARTAQHSGKDGGEPDIKGLPGVHLEVKRTENLRLYDAVGQAKRDAKPGLLRAVPHRKNHCDWVVIMPAEDWFSMYREYEASMAQREAEDVR